MSPTERLNAIHRQLMRWQGGKCERCGKPLGETVQLIRIYANEGGVPAWVRPHDGRPPRLRHRPGPAAHLLRARVRVRQLR